MINLDLIICALQDRIATQANLRHDHLVRVKKAVNWFNEKLIDKSSMHFIGSKIDIDGRKCTCTLVNLDYPSAEFVIVPNDMSEDIGTGAGNFYTKTF